MIFFKTIFFEKFFQDYQQGVKLNSLDPDFMGPDLSPDCLQRLSANDTSRQRVGVAFGKAS